MPPKTQNCCDAKTGICVRPSDGKEFDITKRRFTKEQCTTKPIKGFSMRSSCAPFKDCKK